ncbi:MAG: hypothetical protein CMC35_01740 [Flavobacteriaceae bacterium]|nr:hypothetical protein [Flavobacteriaceae bacterium]|tara:strand:- start:17843 stop:18853 length:1011 start_codon:yes stop_codon:yes gene_type:complete
MKACRSILLITTLLTLAVNSIYGTPNNTLSEEMKTVQEVNFNTDGLYFAEFYDLIFRGHFENIEIRRNDLFLMAIYNQFLRAYGSQCASQLPSNKIELMETVCKRERVTKNGYGTVIDRSCIEYTTIGSGIYAKPDMYRGLKTLEASQNGEAIQYVFSLYSDSNALGNSVDMMHKVNGLKNDLSVIFRLNPCGESGMKRFEENLKRYAEGTSPIRMKTSSKYTLMKESGAPKGNQNYHSLLNDLVANQSKTWMMNRYVLNSISSVQVLSKDTNGAPKTLKANYRYQGFLGDKQGWVKVDFKKGLPNCIYFWDFPKNCKKANSTIVASFSQGRYSKN